MCNETSYLGQIFASAASVSSPGQEISVEGGLRAGVRHINELLAKAGIDRKFTVNGPLPQGKWTVYRVERKKEEVAAVVVHPSGQSDCLSNDGNIVAERLEHRDADHTLGLVSVRMLSSLYPNERARVAKESQGSGTPLVLNDRISSLTPAAG